MGNDVEKPQLKMYFLNKPEADPPRVATIVEMKELTFVMATEKAKHEKTIDRGNGLKVHAFTQDLGDGWNVNYSIHENKKLGKSEAFVDLKLGKQTVESKIVPLESCDMIEPKANRGV